MSEIIVGALVAALSFGATRFAHTYAGASFCDRGGAPMVDVQSLRMKDGTILMKALLLQSMPSTVYIKPEEVWKVLTMVPFDLIKQMPVFLYQGYKPVRARAMRQRGWRATSSVVVTGAAMGGGRTLVLPPPFRFRSLRIAAPLFCGLRGVHGSRGAACATIAPKPLRGPAQGRPPFMKKEKRTVKVTEKKLADGIIKLDCEARPSR